MIVEQIVRARKFCNITHYSRVFSSREWLFRNWTNAEFTTVTYITYAFDIKQYNRSFTKCNFSELASPSDFVHSVIGLCVYLFG